MQPNLAPCSASPHIASRLRQLCALRCFCRTSLRACGSSALCSASPRISRLRQLCALLCFCCASLRACGSKPPERYAPSGLSLPLRFARGPLPLTEPRAATPSGGLPPSGALAHKAAQLHLFVSKTCAFARKAARFHFFAGESSPLARNASRTLLPDQPVSPSLRQLACNVS